MKTNRLRDAAIARASELKLTSEQIAERCAGTPNADHIHAYLTARNDMVSWKLARLFAALDLKPSKGTS